MDGIRSRNKGRVLCLGMFYSPPETHTTPNRGQGFRDSVRCQALEDEGYHVLSLDDKHDEEDWSFVTKKHCKANFADARRMVNSLRDRWGYECAFDYVILDYFFSPAGWAKTRWSDNFFKETIPKIAENELINAGGQLWLPNLQCVTDSIERNFKAIDEYYTIELVRKPEKNPLYKATEGVTTELLRCPDKLTNETQMRPLLNHSKTPFIVLHRRKPPTAARAPRAASPAVVGLYDTPSRSSGRRAREAAVTPSSDDGEAPVRRVFKRLRADKDI